MTADPTDDRLDAGVFLLAGQHPGTGQQDALRDAVRYATAAERAGFDAVWLAEHHFISYGVCPSAIALAGYLLGHTSRIAVGTAACILSNRHPVALGEEAVLLDTVSGGRFRLGVARGGPWVDLEVFGTGLDRYDHGFAEALDLLRAWLSGARQVGTVGEFFSFRAVDVVPRPVQAVPFWVAATSDATVDLAAARGLPLLLGMHVGDGEKAAALARYAAGALEAGHDPARVPHASAHLAHVADTQAAAEAAVRAGLPRWLDRGLASYVRIDGSTGPRRDPGAYTEHLLRLHPVGTPQRCVERLAGTVARTGVRHLLLMPEATGQPAATEETIARLGAEVLPKLR